MIFPFYNQYMIHKTQNGILFENLDAILRKSKELVIFFPFVCDKYSTDNRQKKKMEPKENE